MGLTRLLIMFHIILRLLAPILRGPWFLVTALLITLVQIVLILAHGPIPFAGRIAAR